MIMKLLKTLAKFFSVIPNVITISTLIPAVKIEELVF
jgi:hypothetical protein